MLMNTDRWPAAAGLIIGVVLSVILAGAVPVPPQTIKVEGGKVVLDLPDEGEDTEFTFEGRGPSRTVGPTSANFSGTSVYAPTTIAPGETKVLDVADDATCDLVLPPQTTGTFGDFCVNASPAVSCVVDETARTLKVDAGKGQICLALSSTQDVIFPDGPIRQASAIARLISTFEIESPSTQPAVASLPVQIVSFR